MVSRNISVPASGPERIMIGEAARWPVNRLRAVGGPRSRKTICQRIDGLCGGLAIQLSVRLVCVGLIVFSGMDVARADKLPRGCASKLVAHEKRSPSTEKYAPRPGGYCDGVVSELHAGRLEIRAIAKGPINFEEHHLTVHVDSAKDYILRGWDLRQESTYRLDGPLKNGFLRISLAEAIRPLKLPAEQLGLYAWRKDGLKRIYSPVRTGSPGSVKFVLWYPGRIARITQVTLCPSQESKLKKDKCIEGSQISHEPEPRTHGDTLISITLKIEPPRGLYRLTVQAKETRPNSVARVFNVEF